MEENNITTDLIFYNNDNNDKKKKELLSLLLDNNINNDESNSSFIQQRPLSSNIYQINNDNKSTPSENNIIVEDDINIIKYRKKKLIDTIKDSKNKINNSLYIISTKYDLVYHKYNKISLYILIISTILTSIEAFRLTLITYLDNNNIKLYISSNTISLIINIISLVLGTLLTVLSSVVRFRNYRELMEKLKNTQASLFSYKVLYNKQLELIYFFEISNNLSNEIFQELFLKINTYNDEIKEINIFEDIRTFDILRLNKIKTNYDIEIDKLNKDKEIKLLENSVKLTKKKKEILKNIKIDNLNINSESAINIFSPITTNEKK